MMARYRFVQVAVLTRPLYRVEVLPMSPE